MKESENRQKSTKNFNRKILDRAFILPLLGLFLLLSPLAKIFQIDSLVAGIPFTVLYLFIVWGLLIIGAAYLAGKLRQYQSSGDRDNATQDIDH